MENRKCAITEKRFEYKGYPCVVLMIAGGHRCGYVGLSEDSPFYGKNYEDIPIECHWGLTYGRPYLTEHEDKDTWWIGFDCAHCDDKPDFETALELFKDYPENIKELKRRMECGYLNYLYIDGYSTVRTLEFCIDECKKIVEQLERFV